MQRLKLGVLMVSEVALNNVKAKFQSYDATPSFAADSYPRTTVGSVLVLVRKTVTGIGPTTSPTATTSRK